MSRSLEEVGVVTRAFGSRQIASERTPLLHEIFEATVDLHPEDVAITHGEERVTYAALDRRANRLAHVLHSGATALVTMAAIGARLAPFRGPTILVDADRDWIEAASSARPSRSVTRTGPRDLCYVIYTSGSTGRPKGVMIGLYDTVMGDGACLDALSLLMKGESLPAGTAWAGVPAAPAHAAVWAAA